MTALVWVQNDIIRTLDQGGAAILVLLDLSAALDTIDHSILLSRMESVLGVNRSALQWFKSYLLGRKQRIKINDDFSENQEILWSVPQGSVLGALLFLIYIIPLAQLIRSYGLNNHGYADDTQLCLSFKKKSDNAIVKRKILNLEKCLCDISVWMSQNKLKLNNDKTEIILFGSKKHLAELNIKSLSVAGTDVSVASEPVRNLGAMFDSQLIMAPHVKSVVKKSSFHLRNIYWKSETCVNRRCHKNSDAVTGDVSLGLLQCSPYWNITGFDCKAAVTTKQCSKDSIENQEVCTGYQSNSASNLRSYCWYTRR